MAEFTHKTIAIVPARAGSKRLPGKNLLLLQGKPLIQWTLDIALSSELIDDVLVTSDDPQLLKLSAALGSMTVKRPDELATDTATTFSTLEHAIQSLSEASIFPENILLLQPTSPLRRKRDIEEAIWLMDKKKADSIISVCPVEHPIQWCNRLDDQARMDEFLPKDLESVRSQDLSAYYRLNGSIYLAKTHHLLKNKGFFMPNSYALIMPTDCSVDIDTELDLLIARAVIEYKQKTNLEHL